MLNAIEATERLQAYEPKTRKQAERLLALRGAISKLDIVRGLLVSDEWERSPFEDAKTDSWGHIKIARRVMFAPLNRSLWDRTTTSGNFRVERDLGIGASHAIDANSVSYQSVSNYCDGSSHPVFPIALLETDRESELTTFARSAENVFSYLMRHIKEQ